MCKKCSKPALVLVRRLNAERAPPENLTKWNRKSIPPNTPVTKD